MDSGTRAFWLVLAILLGASAFFWNGVQEHRASEHSAPAKVR